MIESRRCISPVFVVILLLASASPAAGAPLVTQDQPEVDNTATRIQVYENGTARWTVRIRMRLATEQDVERFRVVRARIRNDSNRRLSPFRKRMRGVVADAADATGREMATNFTISTRIQEAPRRWGVVVYEFTWRNFAATRPDSDAIVVSDVFGEGFFIAANDTLAIAAPAGYEVDTVSPTPDRRDAGTLTWIGRVDFADGRPRVRFVPTPATTPTSIPPNGSNPAAGADGDTGDGGSDGGSENTLPTAFVGGVILAVLGTLGAAGLLYLRRAHGQTDESDTDAIPESTEAGGATREQTDELLTDGDRVRNLLRDRGGRVRQKELVEAFGWSDSKTSRVVSRLAEEEEIEKLRIGRENVISLPDTEDD